MRDLDPALDPTDGAFVAAVDALLARGPGRMVPDLARITRLCELLGDPQRAYPSIQVTGTNGKGSATRMISTLLAAAGVQPGTYTSPHLQTVRERIRVGERPISPRAFAEVAEELAPLVGMVDVEHGDRMTFFEVLTAMAFWWFADAPVDVGVFEVGMGGTWDATNLVRGEVAVVQPVDVDHSELGSTPVEVAGEKSGIIKEGAVAVLAAQPPDVLDVLLARCEAVGATPWLAGEAFGVLERRIAIGGQVLDLRVGDRVLTEVLLPLHGRHQADNAAVALAAVAAFLGESFATLDDDVLRAGLGAVTVPGRMEVVHREPTILLDGAHNPHGARAAAETVAESFDFRTLVLVTGVLADKDVRGILAPWRDVVQHVVVTRPPSPRALRTADLAVTAAEVWAGTGVIVEDAEDVADALEKARGLVGPGDGILVSGSLVTVGAAREALLPLERDDDEVIEPPDAGDEDVDEAELQRAIDEMLDQLDDD